jgi:hypothetical protein
MDAAAGPRKMDNGDREMPFRANVHSGTKMIVDFTLR